MGEGDAAADAQVPSMARCARGRDGLSKIAGACDNPGSRLEVVLLGTQRRTDAAAAGRIDGAERPRRKGMASNGAQTRTTSCLINCTWRPTSMLRVL